MGEFLHSGIGGQLVATEMKLSVSNQSWSALMLGKDNLCHAFLIVEGIGQMRDGDNQPTAFSGPSLVWMPEGGSSSFDLVAGASGYAFSIKPELMLRVLGGLSFGVQLRRMLREQLRLPSDKIEGKEAELMQLFRSLVEETLHQNVGSKEIVEANLVLFFSQAWRLLSDRPKSHSFHGSDLSTTQRFQQLIELHYNEGLKVGDYVELLGVTRSHLHDSCLRNHSKTPLVMMHERLLSEAVLRLENTTLSVEQIAYSLGFRDAGYFNRFFKRITGETPGAYRHNSRQQIAVGESSSFAAWP